LRVVIVRRSGGELALVCQSDHARLAADLLALFRLPELAVHPRREALLRAVADHDNGWWEVDAAPRIDPATGAPVDFLGVPDALRRELWERGIARFADADPGRAAQVAAHFLRLFAGRASDPGWSDLLVRERDRWVDLADRAGRSAEEIAADDRWVELADQLSLAACCGTHGPVQVAPWRVRVDETAAGLELRLDPFPLAGTTIVALRERRIEDRRYERDADLAMALAAARWRTTAVRVSPLEAGVDPSGTRSAVSR
jgi:hypothetical protein